MEGGSRGVQVLLSGEIQAMHVGLAPVVQANKQGADLRLVTSTANTIPITIFASPAIKTAADLKGKTIGISTFGSETDVAVSIALQRLGLKRDDVTVSQIGGSSQRFGALIAGRIDAAPLLEPTITAAKQKGFTPLLDLAAANTPWIFDGVVVTNSYLKEHRDALTHFVRAYIAGAHLALSDVDKAKALIAQKYKTGDPTVIDATYNDFKRLMPLDAAPSIAGANNVIAQLQAIGLEVGSKNVNDYVDLSIIEGLKKDGYFEQMAKAYPVKQ
jgi:NitT/TauT family transport system substrate-binding protein